MIGRGQKEVAGAGTPKNSIRSGVVWGYLDVGVDSLLGICLFLFRNKGNHISVTYIDVFTYKCRTPLISKKS